MRVALITPTAHLKDVPDTGYHMVLPQEVMSDPGYADFYRHASGYIILDNGAAEGAPVSFGELLDVAYDIGVNEIVCPDVMGHTEGTIQMSREFLDYVRNNRPQAFDAFKFGLVLQGKSMSEVLKCHNAYGYYKVFSDCTVCYVPRILANNIQKNFRVNFMEAIDQGHVDRHLQEYHALGATHHMKEATLLADTSIRGIDTSQPAVLTHYGIDMSSGDTTARGRKPDFFEAELDRDLLKKNVELYLSWCN